jgi:oxygen-independent coproporphyrinogen-3 oxidase
MLKKHGINRISMGVQSFQPHLLKMMDRKHCVEDIMQCLTWFKEVGITNCSIDLMYALPKQTMSDWQKDLEFACSLDVSHISLYSLTIEPNSKFGRWGVEPIDGDLEFEMYEYAIDYLSNHGFEHYEVSNFARDGLCSKHNIAYWKYDDFYGIGLGSSGKLGNYRYTQSMNFVKYFEGSGEMELVDLSMSDKRFEAVMMGLRMLEGICVADYNLRFECDLLALYKDAISMNLRRGWLEIVDGYLRVTRDGLYLLHEVLVDFMDE